MQRRTLRKGLGFAGFGAPALIPASSRSVGRPNILFLFTDDQRADTIHALGNPVIRTPNPAHPEFHPPTGAAFEELKKRWKM